MGAFTTALVSSAMGMAETRKEAERLGVSLPDFLNWQRQARSAGIDTEQLAQAMRHLEREVDLGAPALKELGLSAEQLRQAGPQGAMEAVAKAVSTIPDPMRRARIEMELFGRSGAMLDPALKGIASGTPKSLVSPEAANALANMGDALKKAKNWCGDMFTNLLGATAALIGFSTATRPAAKGVGEITEQSKETLAAIAKINELYTQGMAKANEKTLKPGDLGTHPEMLEQIKKLEEGPGNPEKLKAWTEAMDKYQQVLAADKSAAARKEIEATVEKVSGLTAKWRTEMGGVAEEGKHVEELMQATAGKDWSKLGQGFKDALGRAQELDKLDFGDKVRKQLAGMTAGPLDAEKKFLSDLQTAMTSGAISQAEYLQGIAAVREKVQEKTPAERPEIAGAERGTAEAWKILVEAMRGGGADQKRDEDAARTARATEEVRQILARMENHDPGTHRIP